MRKVVERELHQGANSPTCGADGASDRAQTLRGEHLSRCIGRLAGKVRRAASVWGVRACFGLACRATRGSPAWAPNACVQARAVECALRPAQRACRSLLLRCVSPAGLRALGRRGAGCSCGGALRLTRGAALAERKNKVYH